MREYRQGDNVRWIHWRRSAQTGQLVVREMATMQLAQLVVIVDPFNVSDGASTSRFRSRASARMDLVAERVISSAATLICDGLERGYRVGLICRADDPVVIAPAGGRRHRLEMLHALALLRPGDGHPLDELISGVRWSTGWQARCAMLGAKWDATHEHVARFLGKRAESVTLLSPANGSLEAFVELPPIDEPTPGAPA